MSADLFFGKRIQFLALFMAILCVFSALCYAFLLWRVETVALWKSFYYLVSPSTHIQASTHITVHNGGAGYLLQWQGGEYVALSVYIDKEAGVTVQSALFETGEETLLLPITVDKLYLKTAKEKQNREKINGAFSSLYGCIQVVNEEIERLLDGATQQSSKRILRMLGAQLSFLHGEYEIVFPKFSKICKAVEQELFLIVENTVYVKDLRHLMCTLCFSYADLSKNFSL